MSRDSRRGAWVDDPNAALLTDLYELTMAAAYLDHGRRDEQVTFELYVRRLPETRSFLIACGIEQAIDYLSTFRFGAEAIGYLRSLALFDDTFLAYLGELRFTGDVWAVPEGDAVFAGEPILSVTAPLIEAQIVETFLLSTVLFQTSIASKAARVAIACGEGRSFLDFSARRDHGPDAALKAARAAFVGGASGTSNVLAGQQFGIPVAGTMAHAYVMSFEHEADAFLCFSRTFPNSTTLLIDTYDTVRGAHRVVEVAKELAAEGITVNAVRLDSGDLDALSRQVRAILDEGGLHGVRILASGDLDEHRVAALVGAGAPIDSFGVGTKLGTSEDAPALGGVYKLVVDALGPRMKTSEGKVTLPGCKQVFRFVDGDGRLSHDVLALADEEVEGGRPVLHQVMAGGEPCAAPEPLAAARERAARTVASLPDDLRRLDVTGAYRVDLSPGLAALTDEVRRRLG